MCIFIYHSKAIILGGYGSGKRRSDGEMWNMDTETWEEADMHLNNARSHFALVVMAEEIDCDSEYKPKGSRIAIGGIGNSAKLGSVEVLNSSCDFPLPETRYAHISVTTADGKTLVCGGSTPSGVTTSCLQFNSQSKTWEHHSTMRSSNRFLSSTIVIPSGVWVIGGSAGGDTSEFLATGSSEWTQGPDLSRGKVFQSCAVKLSDTEFVVLGGYYDRTQALHYNKTSDKWTEWPRLTKDVFAASCVKIGDKILMAGGAYNNDYAVTRRTVIFDTKTGSAREVASLKYPRAYADIELHGGKAVILGGIDGRTGRRTDAEMWNMDTETWEEADISLNIARSHYSLVTMDEEIGCK